MSIDSFSSFSPLFTKRLKLRYLKSTDIKKVFSLRSASENLKYVKRKQMKNEQEAAVFISKINKGIADNKWLYWGITEREEDEILGTITLWQFDENPYKAALGYEMLHDLKGKGIMSEALEAIVQFGFKKLSLAFLEACTDQNNKSSIRILEKNNFNFVRILTEKEKNTEEKDLDLAIYRLKNTFL